MSYLKDFMIFRAEHPELNERKLLAAFEADPENAAHFPNKPATIPEIEDDHDLTWAEIDAATRGRIGTFSLPCPYCGAEKRWSKRFKIERQTLAYARWHCFYCSRSGAVQADGEIDPEKEAAARKRAASLRKETDAARTATAMQIWDAAEPLGRDALTYFHAARRITELPPNLDGVLRWHPHAPWGRRETEPCILALFRDAITDRPTAIHRTSIRYLHMPERRVLGPMGGSVIKLYPLDGSGRLTIGEGIETVLSMTPHTYEGMPLKPAWPATVANNLRAFPLHRKIKTLIILSDNDASETGQDAADALYDRYQDAGRDVLQLTPTELGQDFNDIAVMMEKTNG